MKRYVLWSVFALAAFALALTTSPATAAEDATFTAEFTTTLHGTHEGKVDVFTGTGNASQLGRFSVVIYNHFMGARLESELVFTAANGDELDMRAEQTFDVATSTWSGPFTITGGTGRFADASGDGTIDVVLDFATETAAASLTGKISF